MLTGIELIPQQYYTVAYITCIATALLTFLFLAPLENKNKPLEKVEKQKYGKLAIILTLTWSVIGLGVTSVNTLWGITVGIGIFVVAVMLLIGVAKG